MGCEVWLFMWAAALIAVAILAIGLSSVVYGVVEIALAFEVKNLPKRTDQLETAMNTRRLQSTRT